MKLLRHLRNSYFNYQEAIFWIIIFLSILFFILGITSPLFTTTKFAFFDSSFNFFESLNLFLELKEYFLFSMILGFTLIFPSIKYLLLILNRLRQKEILTIIVNHLAKWSMLDVYVVAIMLLILKMDSGIITFTIEKGTYYLAISVIFSLLLGLLNKKVFK